MPRRKDELAKREIEKTMTLEQRKNAMAKRAIISQLADPNLSEAMRASLLEVLGDIAKREAGDKQ
jgi:hypothetical protein